MNVEFINPFIESTLHVLETMAKIRPIPGKPALKGDNHTWGVVTGLIGMAGDGINGNLLISFSESAALKIVSNLLMEPIEVINKDVVDAVGEITNMISGGAKRILGERGYSFSMATPVIITGQMIELSQLSKSPVVSIPFTTEAGDFVVEANLMRTK